MKEALFTPEELEELKRIDAELDAQPVTLAEYEALDFIEELLFPEKFAKKKRKLKLAVMPITRSIGKSAWKPAEPIMQHIRRRLLQEKPAGIRRIRTA